MVSLVSVAVDPIVPASDESSLNDSSFFIPFFCGRRAVRVYFARRQECCGGRHGAMFDHCYLASDMQAQNGTLSNRHRFHDTLQVRKRMLCPISSSSTTTTQDHATGRRSRNVWTGASHIRVSMHREKRRPMGDAGGRRYIWVMGSRLCSAACSVVYITP